MHHFFTQSIDFKSFSKKTVFIADKNIKPTKHSLHSSNLFTCSMNNDSFHDEHQTLCIMRKKLLISGDVELNRGPIQTENCDLVLSSHAILEQRLRNFNLRAHDVGGAGDCFFRSVSHHLYGDANYHLSIRAAGVAYMRENL